MEILEDIPTTISFLKQKSYQSIGVYMCKSSAYNFLHYTTIGLENNTKWTGLDDTFNFLWQIWVDTYNTNNKRWTSGQPA